MIGHINIGKHISVSGGTLPHFTLNPNPGSGMIRYNPVVGIEVFNGDSWYPVPKTSINLDLNKEANLALDWAIEKMKEEEKIKELSHHNESLRIAYENYKKAEEQLKITANLIQ